MTTQKEVRESFWENVEPEMQAQYKVTKRQNDYCADIRMSFVDYIDHLQRDGSISEKLAARVTL